MSAVACVLLVQAACSVAMMGLIWFVQLVHYPLFARVGAPMFEQYAAGHTRRTTWVVAPLMLGELATALWLLGAPPAPGLVWATWLGIVLLAAVWLSTALVQVPCHTRLQHGFDAPTVARLVASNWVRTVAWTGRGVLSLWLLVRHGAAS